MTTQYDLCYDKVTLDYQELVKTARVAVHYSLDALHRRLRDWTDLSTSARLSNVDAEWLMKDAEALATATLALHYLRDGMNRHEVVIANKPESR